MRLGDPALPRVTSLSWPIRQKNKVATTAGVGRH